MLKAPYLDELYNYISASNEEVEMRLAAADSLIQLLRSLFPYFHAFKAFGSVTRRTGLSRRIDPAADVDILCVEKSADRFSAPRSQIAFLRTCAIN